MDLGYILDIYHISKKVFLTGKLVSGETFQCVCCFPKGRFFIRESDQEAVRNIGGFEMTPTDLRTLDKESVIGTIPINEGITWEEVSQKGVATYEADFIAGMKFQIHHGFKRNVCISGKWEEGKHFDRVYSEPKIGSSDKKWAPVLDVLSLDIMTSPENIILAVSLCFFKHNDNREVKELILTQNDGDDWENVYFCGNEGSLLEKFLAVVASNDPDIIVGRDIIESGLRKILERCRVNKMEFCLGRTNKRSWVSDVDRRGRSVAIVHGRQVLDISRFMRRRSTPYPEFRTDAKDSLVLEKKDCANSITRQKSRDNLREKCLENVRLIQNIVISENILDHALKRSIVTGLSLSRSEGNVAAFDLLYGIGLRSRGFVSPTQGTDRRKAGRAPGGLVLPAQPGMYNNVLVFDFKSLYPSIMLTFNIDPLANASATKDGGEANIKAPNGALFIREPSILSEVLGDLWECREECKRDNDLVGESTYKLIMNAFYGVLAGPGRFASSTIAGAITEFGHHFLRWTKALMEQWGHEVIYGDTDSLFVVSNQEEPGHVIERGRALCSMANKRLREYIAKEYGVESHLELEFEKAYSSFYLPYSRDLERGRSKGYAGLIIGGKDVLEVVGMEAVRRDWTDLAHRIQRQLLRLIFANKPKSEIEDYIWEEVCAVTNGERDGELVYRKRVRKKISDYRGTPPPHVRAAKKGGIQSGIVRYLMTHRGPEPESRKMSPIDYQHYVEKQISPIVEVIAKVYPLNLRSSLKGERGLFE